MIAGLLAIFLTAGPLVGVISGQLAYRAGLRQMQSEQSWREVTATLLQNASDATGVGSNWDLSVTARWKAPNGQPKTGVLPVDSSARTGQHVTIWVDGQGRPAVSPMKLYNVVANAVAMASIMVSASSSRVRTSSRTLGSNAARYGPAQLGCPGR